MAGRDARGLPCRGGAWRARETRSQARLCSPPGPPWCPAFSFGDNELFQQFPNPPGSRLRGAQEARQPLLSVVLPLFQGPLGLLLPFRTRIHAVGEPRPLPPPLPAGAPAPAELRPRALPAPGGEGPCLPATSRPRLIPFGKRPGPEHCPGRSRGWAGRARAGDPNHRPSGVPFCPQWGPRSRCSCSRSARRATASRPPAPPPRLGAPPPPSRCPRRPWWGAIKRGNRAAVCACLCGAVPPGDLDPPGDRHPDPGRAAGACPAALEIPRSQRSFWPPPAAGTRWAGSPAPSEPPPHISSRTADTLTISLTYSLQPPSSAQRPAQTD